MYIIYLNRLIFSSQFSYVSLYNLLRIFALASKIKLENCLKFILRNSSIWKHIISHINSNTNYTALRMFMRDALQKNSF